MSNFATSISMLTNTKPITQSGKSKRLSHTLVMVVTTGLLVTTFGCDKITGANKAHKLGGKIQLSAALQSKVKNTDVLYVIARTQQIGPPTAVKRITQPTFPLAFEIGPEDAMIKPPAGAPTGFEPGTPITLTARLSHSGNAIGEPGDFEGVYAENPAKAGELNLNLIIDKVRE